jgi:hypothetical protein
MRPTSILRAAPALLVLGTTGCIPLTVGSTARPVPVGTTVHSTSMYVVPNSVDDSANHRAYPRYGVDPEVRFGLDDRSDIGIRVPSFSGIVVNYKRRLDGVSEAPGRATALMVGGGLVNWGEHAHLEATLITSAAESDRRCADTCGRSGKTAERSEWHVRLRAPEPGYLWERPLG